MSSHTDPPPLGTRHVRKILCLDGGGIRGLSEIMILQYLMQKLSFERRIVVEPWQEFDMIAGTSTGGLLAIMLGRLRMSLSDAQNASLDFSKRIFTPKRHSLNLKRAHDFLQATGRFESEPLNEHIKALLAERQLPENELLKDLDPEGCKVYF